ncbi:endolytic transglycosylase MltG [Arhodomonas sp. AD133]|uniref:endolytic transglycosylase MltG n=1 Tax=Arhodomonas sp. AD133 TaxID=3415009 RepID=UPI003EBDED36
MKRVIVILLLVAIVVVAGVAALGWQSYRDLDTRALIPDGSSARVVTVEPGTSFAALAGRLTDLGLLDSSWPLRLYARYSGAASRIQAGEYRIEPGMTALELLATMVSGEVVRYRLTVVEGWSYRELIAAVHSHEAIETTLEASAPEALMTALERPGEHPEGRFLPETYRFTRGTTDREILQRAYDAMARVLADEWAGRADGLPLDSPYEALILASIVEKETAVAGERQRIAGVFVRRLRKGMRLQTDPTVIYGLGEAFDGNLRRRDLRADTPYNTYTRSGLPPTPIALPGRASIHAALHPAEGDALYFVARGDGSHVFSSTLEAHNRAVRRYQLGEN